jgi:hypothetical protein
MRIELHLNPEKLTETEFVERARDLLWLLEYRNAQHAKAVSEGIIDAYIKIEEAKRGK